MDSKKSLGHFPFGPDSQGDSDYSFIPDLNGSDDVDVAEFDDTEAAGAGSVQNKETTQHQDSGEDNEQYIQVGSVKVKRSSHTESFKNGDNIKEAPDFMLEREIYRSSPSSESESEGLHSAPVFKTSNKKVVSYYLEEELIEQVKIFADKRGESYSAVAATAFREFLAKNEE